MQRIVREEERGLSARARHAHGVQVKATGVAFLHIVDGLGRWVESMDAAPVSLDERFRERNVLAKADIDHCRIAAKNAGGNSPPSVAFIAVVFAVDVKRGADGRLYADGTFAQDPTFSVPGKSGSIDVHGGFTFRWISGKLDGRLASPQLIARRGFSEPCRRRGPR